MARSGKNEVVNGHKYICTHLVTRRLEDRIQNATEIDYNPGQQWSTLININKHYYAQRKIETEQAREGEKIEAESGREREQ